MRLLGRMALVAAAIGVGVIASPPVLASDIPSFREWIAGQDVALYVFDGTHSDWTLHREWLAHDGGCGLAGIFRFRRLDQLQGRLPHTLTVRIASLDDLCPMWFIGDLAAPPVGRWIVASYDPDFSSWWHVSPTGRVDTRGTGAGGPESWPRTLGGWYRTLGLPDTATESHDLDRSDSAPPRGVVLAAAAVIGLVIWIRRRASRATKRGDGPAPAGILGATGAMRLPEGSVPDNEAWQRHGPTQSALVAGLRRA